MTAPRRLVLATIEQWQGLKPSPGQDGIACLDMTSVEELDSAGVALLVQWAAELGAQQGRLQLTQISTKQRALVTLCGVDSLLL